MCVCFLTLSLVSLEHGSGGTVWILNLNLVSFVCVFVCRDFGGGAVTLVYATRSLSCRFAGIQSPRESESIIAV